MSQSNMGFGMESFDAYSVLSEFGKPSEREESPSIEKFMADMVRGPIFRHTTSYQPV